MIKDSNTITGLQSNDISTPTTVFAPLQNLKRGFIFAKKIQCALFFDLQPVKDCTVTSVYCKIEPSTPAYRL